MINKHRKGVRREYETAKLFETEGWRCERKPRTRWQPDDFWGLWDGVCYHPEKGWLLFNSKSGSAPREFVDRCLDFDVPARTRKVIVLWQDRKEEPKLMNIPRRPPVEATE